MKEPIKHYQLKDIVNFDFENHTANIIQNICAQVIDNTDKVIVDVIIKAAKENGITDLYLMDKKFVLDALQEKAEREKNNLKEGDFALVIDNDHRLVGEIVLVTKVENNGQAFVIRLPCDIRQKEKWRINVNKLKLIPDEVVALFKPKS